MRGEPGPRDRHSGGVTQSYGRPTSALPVATHQDREGRAPCWTSVDRDQMTGGEPDMQMHPRDCQGWGHEADIHNTCEQSFSTTGHAQTVGFHLGQELHGVNEHQCA
jgi:hypothetical protein